MQVAFSGERNVGKTTTAKILINEFKIQTSFLDLGESGWKDPLLSMYTACSYIGTILSRKDFIADRWLTDVLYFSEKFGVVTVSNLIHEFLKEESAPKVTLIYIKKPEPGEMHDFILKTCIEYNLPFITLPALPSKERINELISYLKEVS